MATQIQLRRGTTAEWTASNPVLAEGEFGLETDTNKLKIGNGVATWGNLTYAINEPGTGGVSSYNDLTDLPTLGTAAATASTDYATAAQGAKADSALQSGAAISDISGLQTALDGKAVSGHTHSAATSTAAGFMSATDKTKLDGAASLAGVQTLTNKTIQDGTFTNGYTEEASSSTISLSTYTVDILNGTVQLLTLSAALITFTFPTPIAGKSFFLTLKQDGTGGRAVAWPASVKWASGTTPTITTTASKSDVFSFVCVDGASWIGIVVGQNYTI